MTLESTLNNFPFFIHLNEGATSIYPRAYTLNLPRMTLTCDTIRCGACPLYIPNTHYECADLAINYVPESIKSSYPEYFL